MSATVTKVNRMIQTIQSELGGALSVSKKTIKVIHCSPTGGTLLVSVFPVCVFRCVVCNLLLNDANSIEIGVTGEFFFASFFVETTMVPHLLHRRRGWPPALLAFTCNSSSERL